MSAGRSACQVFTGDRTSWVQAETQGEERGGALISDRSSNGSAAKGIEAKGDTGLIGDRDSVVRFQPLNEMSRRGPDSDSMASVRAAADHTTFSRLCWNARSTDAGEQSADGIDSNAQPPALQCRGFGRSTCRSAVVRWCGGAVVRWCGGAVVVHRVRFHPPHRKPLHWSAGGERFGPPQRPTGAAPRFLCGSTHPPRRGRR